MPTCPRLEHTCTLTTGVMFSALPAPRPHPKPQSCCKQSFESRILSTHLPGAPAAARFCEGHGKILFNVTFDEHLLSARPYARHCALRDKQPKVIRLMHKSGSWQCGRPGIDPWRKEWPPTPVCLPGEFHGQRSLVGYNPWGRKESDMTERLSLHFTKQRIQTKK